MRSKIHDLLNEIRGVPLSRQERSDKTIALASDLLQETHKARTYVEKKQERWISQIMEDPNARLLLTYIADLAFRTKNARRLIHALQEKISEIDLPKSFPEKDQLKLLLLSNLGHLCPPFFMKSIQRQLLTHLEGILLWGDEKKQERLFKHWRKEGVIVNLNHLGEAILGEHEAKERVERYINDLREGRYDYISVKISTLYSQIKLTAFEQTLVHLKEQLRRLYREAKPTQFVNLDMEEFKDLDLTVALFKEVLDEPEFHHTYAGIALQAYLPNSFTILQELITWATKRQKGPIKIRLVKGANLGMEEIEAAIKNWTRAPYAHKWESDANFKKMLEYALHPSFAKYVHISIASHNLFDIAYGLILRAERELEQNVSFEMLSGMAKPLQRVLLQYLPSLTLYCPETKKEHFQHAISYLIRRFDENGSKENFLRHFFLLEPGNFLWQQEAKRFRYAVSSIDSVSAACRREVPLPSENEPLIDFALEKNRARLKNIYSPRSYPPIPCVIGKEIVDGPGHEGIDPSTRVSFYQYHCVTKEQIDNAFDLATGHCPHVVFKELASVMQEHRDALLTAMIADGGKTIAEADPEISEMIDFVTYYSSHCFDQGKPRGTILVAPPWNFPAAIPTGGIVAALVTGNSVLFKPASETVLIGWEIAKLFWQAGVPKTTLQFIPCNDPSLKDYLLCHPKLSGVILTGATETAQKMLALRPNLYLMAETGGKNSIIVSALADRDLAVRDLVSSAFGHSGQKCSACSLGILEEEVYHDPAFLNQLKDATTSLYVGSSWDPKTSIGPLIRPPNEKLLKALTELEEGESWLVAPKQLSSHLWTPGIKLGIRPGSFFHQTECFGPVLGLMPAKNLEHAISLANQTPYGLTSGLHSLDPREHALWKRSIIAGNLYINRNITGAIVGRQPFGGCKASSFGPGKKAGGPLYCNQLVHLEDQPPQETGSILPQSIVPLIAHVNQLSQDEKNLWKVSVESYAYWAQKYKTPIETSTIKGQQNLYYLVPKDHIIIRYQGEPMIDLLRVLAACLICQTPFTLSSVKPLDIACQVEKEVSGLGIRFLSKTSSHPCAIDSAVMSFGKLEIPHYLREISLSFDYHRYGYAHDDVSS